MKAFRMLSTAAAAATLLAMTVAAQTTSPTPQVTNIPAPGTTAARAGMPPVVVPKSVAPTASQAATAVPTYVAPPPDPNAAEEAETAVPEAEAATGPASTPAVPAAARAATPMRTEGSTIVPQGTPIALQLETQLNTQYTSVGDGFAARVMTPVYYRGQEVIPTGAILEGHVMHVQDARPARSQSELLLKPDLLVMPSGQKYTISAEVIQDDPHAAARVDTEGMLREPRGMLASDIHHTEIGGAGGFIGGAVLAGGQGALAGAGIGAAVAIGIWLVRRRHLVLNPGSQLTVRLQRPIQLRPVGSN